MLLSACAASHDATRRPVVTTTTASLPPAPECDVAQAGTVRRLPSLTGSVWIWIETASRPTPRVGSLIKVVWRITGSGAPRASLTDPRGRASRLAFGPELHTGSTFRHPGAEYGTGFKPDTAGCWRLTMRRGEVGGSVSFVVVD
jgi:hypothetical protein